MLALMPLPIQLDNRTIWNNWSYGFIKKIKKEETNEKIKYHSNSRIGHIARRL